MINTTENSFTYDRYVPVTNSPRVATFEKVSFEQFKTAIETFIDNIDTGTVPLNDFLEATYKQITLPERATSGSAGYDFRTPIPVTLDVNQAIVIPTGIRCSMQNSYVLQLYPRSGLGFKFGMELVNTVGIIDADYYFADNEGHILIKIRPTIRTLQLKQGDKFAQGIFIPYGITQNDEANGRRFGGIGSTGK